MSEPHPDTPATYDRPSKTQIKREMLELRELGSQLVGLSDTQLKKMLLPENVYLAICEAQNINSREGRRRQINYVGKLLRNVDSAIINEQLITLKHGSRKETQNMHKLETLRDLLIDNDDTLTELLTTYPTTNIQNLRALIRAARKENLENASLTEHSNQAPQRKHYRALYQALKEITTENQ